MDKLVWAFNQNVPKFIINPKVMLPQLVSEKESKTKHYNIYNSSIY